MELYRLILELTEARDNGEFDGLADRGEVDDIIERLEALHTWMQERKNQA